MDDGEVTTARLFYNEINELSDESILLSPIWGQPGLAIEHHHKEEGRGAVIVGYSKVVYRDRYSLGTLIYLELIRVIPFFSKLFPLCGWKVYRTYSIKWILHMLL